MEQLRNIGKCPYCGGVDFTEGQARYISPVGDGFHGSVLYHRICLDCGTIVRSYIKDLKPFLKKGIPKEL